jgi:hypothetical protein
MIRMTGAPIVKSPAQAAFFYRSMRGRKLENENK